jgi:tRNA (mo5U34)-methyltransferase
MVIFGVDTSPQAERIARVKAASADPDFDWYRYDSLANLQHLKALLGRSEAPVIQAARDGGVLDLGCGDGDLAFFFESLGCQVDAVDHPIPNHNGMRGVRRLKQELSSQVQIHEVDLDSQFTVPQDRYGLAIFLGILYHLKNPFYALEQVARHANYCVLSTRVARLLPNGTPIPEGEPLVYLLDADELNDDNSNYWIFSNPGLRRLLKRAQWEVVEWLNVGDTQSSDPVSLNHDERAFCLLRSHHSMLHVELLGGWHDAEASGWRWTERTFSARFQTGKFAVPSRLALKLYLPPEVFNRVGTVTLSGRINGERFVPAVLDGPGDHTVLRGVTSMSGDVTAEFELDKFLAPSAAEPRELGVIVASIEVD